MSNYTANYNSEELPSESELSDGVKQQMDSAQRNEMPSAPAQDVSVEVAKTTQNTNSSPEPEYDPESDYFRNPWHDIDEEFSPESVFDPESIYYSPQSKPESEPAPAPEPEPESEPEPQPESKPKLKPKPPTIRIAIEEAKMITRPLCLIDGKAYATVWQRVETVTTEIVGPKGNIIKLDPPEIMSEIKLVVVCSDGTSYGGNVPIDNLGIEIHLREKISPENNWGGAGIMRFKKGEHPHPADVFERLILMIDHFIDFHKSLADQRPMCEFIACWILATWFLDAFKVTGYLWINGERGSGKSNLLMLISLLSYLGSFISQSGSFASLRDMADYGATLACDDAENLTDPKKSDPNKTDLLLVGNRKGITIPVKEPAGSGKTWTTRHVNGYCSRAFSAIRVPDSTMASRCIILPMLRTPDKSKGNIDPMDTESWPVDRRQLIDDLWGLALKNLPDLPSWDKKVGKHSKLVGRNLQPWRSILAVAAYLEDAGVDGLYDRMEKLSIDYQNNRPELELADTTRVTIQALVACAIRAIKANSANKNVKLVNVKVQDVTQAIINLIEEDDIDLMPAYITSRKIGKILAKLRFPEAPRVNGKGSRMRSIDLKDLAELAKSYNVEFDDLVPFIVVDSNESLPNNGTNGINGTNGFGNGTQEGFELNFFASEPEERQCRMCGFSRFWQRPDGGWVCGVCHPNPADYSVKPGDNIEF